MSERQLPVNIEEELKSSYLDYAMSVIVNRALPDARDGLKPVQRRILVAMRELNLLHNRPYRKSAKISGDVTGNYHPHGTVAVYDTMVRMVQDFSLRYPLVDGQGNFGSVDGDGAAAERYTEARLTLAAEQMLEDLDRETVDRRPNYDETREEPVVLPARFPNLLVNGATGIAVGMATNVPPHNLGEVADGLCRLLDNPELTAEDLMETVRGPDFPTAGIIYGTEGIRDAYRTGRGLITIRARAEIDSSPRTGRDRIIITELPYQVNKAALLEKIAQLVKQGVISGIQDIRDESDRDGMRAVIDIKKDTPPQIILNQLFKHTAMQTTFGANMVALVNLQPRQLSLKELLQAFLDHRREVILRRTRFDLDVAEKRAHIIEGLKKALDEIDAVISKIRESRDIPTARLGLMTGFGLTELQANAILEMRLQRLTGLERQKLDDEYLALIKEIERLKTILGSETTVRAVIREEILEVKAKFADARRTEIVPVAAGAFEAEDLIPEEDMVVTISHFGYIKRLPLATYRSQRRGGRGKTGATIRESDWVEDLFIASTHTYILFFTDQGRCYWLKVHEIPQAGRAARGKAIVNCLQLQPDEGVTAFTRVSEFDDRRFLVMATAKGRIKKVPLSAFSHPRRAGIIAVNLLPDDKLIEASLTDGDNDIILATRRGRAIRFPESRLRPMGRTAGGVRGITLAAEDDRVVAMVVVKRTATLLTVTEKGFGKRSDINAYRRTSRGGKGVINMRITEKNGPVVAIREVSADDQIMLITSDGIVIRVPVKDVQVRGRATQGVRLIAVSEGHQVTDVARVDASKAEERVAATGGGAEDEDTRGDGGMNAAPDKTSASVGEGDADEDPQEDDVS